jgi:hypothetical protein
MKILNFQDSVTCRLLTALLYSLRLISDNHTKDMTQLTATYFVTASSSSSSAALQPGMGFGLLYKLIPLLSISSQPLPILHLDHFHIFEDSIDSSILGSSCWPFPKWFPVG